jgi:hypothetical protein
MFIVFVLKSGFCVRTYESFSKRLESYALIYLSKNGKFSNKKMCFKSEGVFYVQFAVSPSLNGFRDN